jgi:two-component system, OmpR family, alkaline phosphatase synthesis response regulator PhoP
LAKVMLVDDDKTTITLLQMLLSLDGFDVVTAGRGSEVMPLARSEMPELFMIDYHLNDMVGADVVRTLRADPNFAKTPIVIASGMNVESEVMKAGATLFLVKPLEPAHLGKTFQRLIDEANEA